jgi:hypothetical protein
LTGSAFQPREKGPAPFDRLAFAAASRGSVFFKGHRARQNDADMLKC